MRLILYQTLEDRGNPEEIEDYGPFICRNKYAWLGLGYYFWDSHIELGHWWGRTTYREYIICKAKGFYDEYCWDLHGNGLHRIEFENICKTIIDAGISTEEDLLVPEVIEFLKKNKQFSYKSIRALGINSISSKINDTQLIIRMQFKKTHFATLDLRPPIQIWAN
ncbi:MAG TPA: hypothetical protein VIL78_14365 [Hanamia sp.]